MKILICGAHFTPAQATIESLKKMSESKIIYIGRYFTREGDNNPSPESQILPKMGVKFISITTGRLQRSITLYTLTSLLKIPVGFIQAFYFILREKPNVVLSFGGYVSVPVVIVSWLLSIPIIIHEQTLLPGLASRISGWFANKVAVTFDELSLLPKERGLEFLSKDNNKMPFAKEKMIVTGNPIRRELIEESKVEGSLMKFVFVAKKRKRPVILITGGNQGAHFINELAMDSLDGLLKMACVIHQSGNSRYNDFEKIQELTVNAKNSENYFAETFFEAKEMGYILRNADLVVSRGGVNTLLELAFFGVPTIIIPIHNHHEQYENAGYFKSLGLSQTLYQKDLDSKKFLDLTHEMLIGRKKLKVKAKKAGSIATLSAADKLALETLLLA